MLSVDPGGFALRLAVVVALIAGACASSDPAPIGELLPGYPEAGTREVLELGEVLYAAGAIVQGEVVAVRGPFWNSADGAAWIEDDYPDSYASPTLYREVDLRLTSVLRDDIGLAGVVTISVRGTGKPEEANHGGTFEIGDEVVVALVESYQLFRDGPVDRIYPLGGRSGVFDVVEGELIRQARRPEEPNLAIDALPIAASDARLISHPEWDDLRYPPTAEEQLKAIEARVGDLRREVERIEADPNNVCKWVGDLVKAEAWVAANPEAGRTVDELMDEGFIEEICDGPPPLELTP